jgi:hypothetical protein
LESGFIPLFLLSAPLSASGVTLRAADQSLLGDPAPGDRWRNSILPVQLAQGAI